jgi:methylated-DNA-[protein]-cysteine S-methyltransferase
MRLRLERVSSPISRLRVVSDNEGVLRALDFDDYEARMHQLLRDHYRDYTLEERSVPDSITRALHAYFGGELDALDDIPTATGGTAFQRQVWKALRTIPAGNTLSYGELATRIGRPSASRAVGAANGANPIAIVVPCHRVIGANGMLSGYGGGVHRKQWLLDHERHFGGIPDLFPMAADRIRGCAHP